MTRDGVDLSVRPIRSADREALLATIRKLSTKSHYRRFMSPLRAHGESELKRLTDLDHIDHEALVAIAPGGEIVGVARFIRLGERPDAAEVAVTIADEWQRRGIGTALVSRLSILASEVGVRVFVATCFADNTDMLAVFHDLPHARYTQTGSVAGVVEVELKLPADDDHTHLERAVKAGAATFSSADHPAAPG